jgi:hypothetical protein
MAGLAADARTATPGMGAERMAMTFWLSGILWWRFGYQPRHRSKRQVEADAGRYGRNGWDEPAYGWSFSSAGAEPPADAFRSISPGNPDLLGQLTGDQLRQMLEGCALNDVTRILRPLVQIIAHRSHSATTLAHAWSDFRRSTREAYSLHVGTSRWSEFFNREELGSYPAEDAVELKLRAADNAWWLLTNGVS